MEREHCERIGKDNVPVARTPGLYVSHRGDRTLVLAPDAASWAVIPGSQYRILEQLEHPLFFNEIVEKNPGMDSLFLYNLLENFYNHGMIEMNWKKKFPPPEIMWRPVDDYPVYPRDFYFHMTDACNFRCRYCYADADTKGRSIRLETMKFIMEKIFRDIPDESISFVFHGGEPLLLKKTIIEATRFAEKVSPRYNKRCNYSIQTNGALIDQEVIEYAKRYNVEIGVTLDGPREIHDEFRVYPDGSGTFKDVWEASQRAIRAGVGLGYICIVHKPENYMRSYEFFLARGIFSFNLRYSFAVGRALKSYEFTLEKGTEMAHGILKMLDVAVEFYKRTGIKLRINDVDSMMKSLVSKKRNYMCLRSPCGIGRSIISFGPDGEMYPCEEMSAYRDLSCGSIKDPRPLTEIIDTSEMLKKLRTRRVESIPRCKDCPWRRFCMGRCTHKTIHYFDDYMREDPSCSFFSTLFEELMWKISDDKTILTLA